MDRNTLLAVALSLLVLTAYMAYQTKRQAEWKAQQEAIAEQMAAEGVVPDESAETPEASPEARPAAEHAAPSTPKIARPTTPPPPTTNVPEQVVRIEGDRFTAELTNRGAAISSWKLDDFPLTIAKDSGAIDLVNLEIPNAGVLRTPFLELGQGDLSEAMFEIESRSENAVAFVLSSGGVTVRKTYLLDLESYEFSLDIEVENHTTGIVSPQFEVHWPARTLPEEHDFTETGLLVRNLDSVEREMVASVGQPGFFGGLFGGDPNEIIVHRGHVDWAGMELKFFVGALFPDAPKNAEVTFHPWIPGEMAYTALTFDPVSVGAGQSHKRVLRGFIGPKKEETLIAVQPNFEGAINFGYSWLAPLTALFHWLLRVCYGLIPNYGFAIIIITVGVRVLTAPIMAKQMKSMERMRELQPRMKEIQEKYRDDRQKQSEATMELYRETGVNPLGGCFPMLLQFPVFIGLFYALQSSIDLRHAEFVLWINDLSSPEVLFTLPGIGLPIRVLPIAMGISMFAQQKMTPTTGMDPAQARMMLIVMPIMMTVLFYQFPSGLVLYWMVSNVLGIGQQLLIRRNMNEGS